jgi:hypothetical protein
MYLNMIYCSWKKVLVHLTSFEGSWFLCQASFLYICNFLQCFCIVLLSWVHDGMVLRIYVILSYAPFYVVRLFILILVSLFPISQYGCSVFQSVDCLCWSYCISNQLLWDVCVNGLLMFKDWVMHSFYDVGAWRYVSISCDRIVAEQQVGITLLGSHWRWLILIRFICWID